jgi:hypothetical protein
MAVERKSLFGVVVLAEGAMPASLPATGAATFQEFSGKYPLVVLDVVVESLDKLGLKLGHGRKFSKNGATLNRRVTSHWAMYLTPAMFNRQLRHAEGLSIGEFHRICSPNIDDHRRPEAGKAHSRPMPNARINDTWRPIGQQNRRQ